MTVRAGGHVLGASGWEPEAVAGAPAEKDMPASASTAEAGTPEEEPDTETETETEVSTAEAGFDGDDDAMPQRAGCDLCGKEVQVNKDGSLRKHACVTPDEEGGD